uniref:Uncharacterized protein n=1 Tax=Panagrolaimus superbus TaxID=310955 RepID=A0A914YCY0_9BILA
MQNSIIPSLAASQLGIPPSLQLNTLSPQSLSLLLEGLKTFCNSNMSNGNIQIPNIPSLSFPATSTTQGTVAVNQVSPAPSDPIPPIHGSPPKDNNSVNNNLNSNLITCCGPTSVNTQTQGIFSYPTATNTVCGITQLFGLGSNFNQLNHYMNMNMNQNQTLSTTQGVATTITNLTVEPSTSYSSNIIQPEGDIIIAEHEEQHNSPASPSFDDSQEDRNLNSMTFPVVEAIESPDTSTHEIPEETLEEIDQHEQEETEMEMDVSNEETTLNSEPSPLNSEPFDGKTDASSSKKREDEDFIEVDDFEPKVECHVPIQALSTLPERQRIAPLKINLKLLRASRQPQPKPIKRKSSHKSRKSYKEDDDDNDSDNDNEYKSRIKTEDFDSFDTCYTDPLALRKIQRKTSSQIKQEHETFIEQIYNQPDDKKKLKVVYPNVQAEIIYNPGDYVTKFIGDIVTSRSVYNQNKDNPFLIEIGRNKWIDGKDRRSFGVYILPAEVPHQANTTIKASSNIK